MGTFKRENSKYYQYTFNYKGKRYKGSTKKTNKRDADEWAAKKREQLINETVGLYAPKIPPMFSAFTKDYLLAAAVRHQHKPETLKFYQNKLKNLLKFTPLKNARLDHIDESMIDRYKASRRGVVKVSTCNRELATLSVILNFAYERKHISRVPKIAKGTEGEGRTYVLAHDKEEMLLNACNETLSDLVPLLADTGLRIGEAVNLTWEDVHCGSIEGSQRGHIHVRRGKSKNAQRNVPLTPRAVQILKGRRIRSKSRWVFPGKTPDQHLLETSADHIFRKTRDSIKNDAGERVFPEEFVLHSLRHTCLTRLGAAGAPVFDIMRIAGHASIATSQRYVHPTSESAQKAIALLDAANRTGKNAEPAESLPHSLPQFLREAA